MEVYCTRPKCQRPKNYFPDLDDSKTLKTAQQRYCTSCGMALILRDRYLPTKLLGKGGFGTAFLAIDRDTPKMRQCVVKQFQPSSNLTAEELEKSKSLFELEAGVLEEIGKEHQQIPELFAFFLLAVPSFPPGQNDEFFYIVQEYIDGQNLEEELRQKGQFSEVEVMELLEKLLPVLQFIHDRKIIHRDIKPSNIMRRQDGTLFLLDFGAVKQVTNASGISTKIHSIGFAPPEQMGGNEVFPSTDLYAFAATILNLLTGEEPNRLFDSYNNQWIWRNKITLNTPLADVLEKMLLPAVNQRFHSAQEVLETLFRSSSTQVPTVATVNPISVTPTIISRPPAQPLTSNQKNFSIWELLIASAFSGFEIALIAIAFFSIVKNPIITFVISLIILTGMIFGQTKKWIKKKHLLSISGITFLIVCLFPFLHKGFSIPAIIIVAIGAALVSITITALFKLIYKLLSSIL